MRKRLIFLFTFLGGLYYFLEFVLPPYLPTSAPSAAEFMRFAAAHGGKPTGDGAASFPAAERALETCRDLRIPMDLPPALAGRPAALEWIRTGTMLGRIGVRAEVDAAPDDPASLPGWEKEPPFWVVGSLNTFDGLLEFERVCAASGGTPTGREGHEFAFAEARQARDTGRKLGVAIPWPDTVASRPARLARFQEGRLVAKVLRDPADAPGALPGSTPEASRWSRSVQPHGYFMIGGQHEAISDAFIVFFIAAIGLGLVNVFMAHGTRLIMRRKGWIYSAALLVSLAAMLVAGFYDWYNDEAEAKADREVQRTAALMHVQAVDRWEAGGRQGAPPPEADAASLKTADPAAYARTQSLLPSAFARNAGLFYKHLLMGLGGLFTGLQSAMFSLLALYIAAAAYRAFRMKSGEAVLMMFTALLVMLGQIPMGVSLCDPLFQALGLHGGIVAVRAWIMEVINTAAFRGIYFGSQIAMLAMGIRMWLSMETGSFSQD